MNKYRRTSVSVVATLSAVLILSACGGGSSSNDTDTTPPGGDGGTTPPVPPSVSFDDLTSSFDTLFAGTGFLAVQLPATGSASFAGAAVYGEASRAIADIQANPSLASKVELNLNFDARDVTGRFFDFQASDPSVVFGGELNVVDGSIPDPRLQYQGRLEGSLTANGTTFTIGGANSRLVGESFPSGVTAGTVALDAGSDGSVDLQGLFAAD